MTEVDEETRVQNSGSSAVATTAKVLGIISIFFALFVPALGILLALIAIIMGVVSLKSVKRKSAVTGITTGAVALFVALLMMVIPVMYAGIQQRAEQSTQGQ